jgi:hypothetical protein
MSSMALSGVPELACVVFNEMTDIVSGKNVDLSSGMHLWHLDAHANLIRISSQCLDALPSLNEQHSY